MAFVTVGTKFWSKSSEAQGTVRNILRYKDGKLAYIYHWNLMPDKVFLKSEKEFFKGLTFRSPERTRFVKPETDPKYKDQSYNKYVPQPREDLDARCFCGRHRRDCNHPLRVMQS